MRISFITSQFNNQNFKEIEMNRITLCFVLVLLLALTPSAFSRSLQEIKNSGEIIIGFRDRNVIPVDYIHENKRTGIDADLRNLIATHLGVKWKPKHITSPQRETSLLKDEVDLVVSTFSVTPNRQKKIDFSRPYYITGVGLMLSNKYKNQIYKFEDLAKFPGLKISVEAKTSTMYKAFKGYFPDLKLNVYNTGKESLNSFLKGETDGFSQDHILLPAIVAKYPGKGYILENTISADAYCVGVNKKYQKLLNEVNTLIQKIENNGQLQEIIDKHMYVVPKPKQSKARIHRVVRGNTLMKLSKKYYGTPEKWKLIFEANRNLITYPNNLHRGVQLKIPYEEPDNNTQKQGTPVSHQPTTDKNELRLLREFYEEAMVSKQKLQMLKEFYEEKLIHEDVYKQKQKELLEKVLR